jgi:Zn-dependent M28 family amino/carboxypeptidase
LLAPGFYERSIKFICFAGEEQGLCGSSEYAGRALNEGDAILAVLNLDMIGYVDVAPEDVDVVSDSASEWLADFAIDCAGAYVPTLSSVKNVNPGMVYSDHASFWRLGYEAVDCAEDSPIVYPAYHTTGDTLGNLDQSFATDVVRMGVAALAELAVPDTTATVTGRPELAAVTAAYPNPFKATTKLTFVLGVSGKVTVCMFDVEGRLVKTLIKTPLGAGRHDVVWDGTDSQGTNVSPGVYFARVKTEEATRRAKVVRLR